MTEQTLATYGLRGKRVRVYSLTTPTGTKLVRCEWREHGRRVRESWPDTRENRRQARAYAEGVAERLAQRGTMVRARLSLRELVSAYLAANDHWRPMSVRNVTQRLRAWLIFAGETFPADRVTPEMLDEFRGSLRKIPREKTGQPMAPNQIAHHAAEVKHLFRFAKARDLIARNPLEGYVIRLGKDERRQDMAEYSNDEWARVLAQLSPRKALQWRSYTLLVLAGILGPRQRALRHLTWDDVDLVARTVTWRRQYDKTGQERVQPLPRDAVRAFRIARVWRGRDGYEGSWVFYGAQRRTRGQPYDYGALNKQLHEAERRAGVEHKAFRALHGLRRTAAGNVLAVTGGRTKDAGDWIGDRDGGKSLQKYLKVRDERLREVAGLVSVPASVPEKTTEQPSAAPAATPLKGGR